MPVGPVAEGLARNSAEADLVELVPLAVLVVARVHEVRAVGESCRAHEGGIALAEEPAEHVEDAAERVRAARKGRRLQRLQQRALGYAHVHQVVEAVVEQDLRVEHHDHVHAREHLEHLFVQQEIDRGDGLRIRAGEIEDALVTLAPHRAGDLVRAHVHAVVADIVLEVLLRSPAPCGGSARASRACCARAWRPSRSRRRRRRIGG